MTKLSNRIVTASLVVVVLILGTLLAFAQGGSGREAAGPAAKKASSKKKSTHRRVQSGADQNEDTQAVPPVVSVPRPTPMPGEFEYERGVNKYAAGSYSEAITLFKEAIDINPNYYRAYNYLGNAYYSTNRYDEAATVYERLLSLVTSNSSISNSDLKDSIGDLFIKLAYSYRRLGRNLLADEVQQRQSSFCAYRKC